jgi:hypothetical protein
MAIPSAMTELEAVNILLTTIGEAPVNTLTGNQVTDVTIANQVINEVSREVQSMGWHFNTEYNVPLTPDISNQIPSPANVARIDSKDYDIVIRENKLFNLLDRTYTFNSKILADIVYFQDFLVLPEIAKKYVTARAARIYADRMINSSTINQMTSRDEEKALMDLKAYEGDTADYNMMDNYSVARVLNRGFNQRILM